MLTERERLLSQSFKAKISGINHLISSLQLLFLKDLHCFQDFTTCVNLPTATVFIDHIYCADTYPTLSDMADKRKRLKQIYLKAKLILCVLMCHSCNIGFPKFLFSDTILQTGNQIQVMKNEALVCNNQDHQWSRLSTDVIGICAHFWLCVLIL